MKFLSGLLRDWGVALVIFLAGLALFTWLSTPAPRTEGPAPPFSLADLEGNTVTLDDLQERGEVVVLNFWFTDCPPCRREIPELSAFAAEHPDVPLVGISIDTRLSGSGLLARSRRLGVDYPVLHDPEMRVAGAYGVGVYPTTVLVREGRIVGHRTGEVTKASLERMVDAAR